MRSNKRQAAGIFLALFTWVLSSAQTIVIDNANFQTGPFGQGSTVGVPVMMSGCFKWNNTVRLFLCNPVNPTGVLIGTFNQNGFFTTFVNGRIPPGTAPRTDYYLEARTDLPVSVSNHSTAFEIKTTAAPTSFINTTSTNRRLIDSLYYGYCSGNPSTPRPVTLLNQSTPGSVTTVSYKDERTGAVTPLALPVGSTTTITLDVAFYSLFCNAENNGVISTRYFFLVNPTHNSGLLQSGEQKTCLPDPLRFSIDTSSGPFGIGRNFSGVFYVYDWGDASPNDTLTQCQLLALNGIVLHVYTDVSCGKTAVVGGTTYNNAYPVDIKYVNPFKNSGNTNNCDEFSNSAFARIFRRPQANFTFQDPGCVNRPVTFTNTTVGGVAQSGSVCTNAEDYEWYVDGVFITNNRNLIYTFPATGTYLVRLKVENASCAPSEITKQICIESAPVADFKLNGQDSVTDCAPLPVNTTNLTTSSLCTGRTWKWRVYDAQTGALIPPNTGIYTVAPNDTAFQPVFTFLMPGRYRIEMTVNSGCGPFIKNRIVNITGSAGVALPPDKGYCKTNVTIDFGTDPAHKPVYNSNTGNETFQWTVTGGAYSFQGGTTALSKYPVINFADNAVYTVAVTITNSCGIKSDTQRIAFSPQVTAAAGPDLTICFSQNTVSLTGAATGVVDSLKWVTGGTGSFGSPASLSTVYTLSAADKTAAFVYLVLRAFAPAGSVCGTVSDTLVLKVFPNNTGSNVTKAICSGTAVNYTPSSSVAGSTFTWTSTVISGTVSGNSPSSSGSINDVLQNTGVTNAVVEYTILPKANNCDGVPFTLTVTVRPKPVLTATAVPDTVCSGIRTNIQLISNVANTAFSYSSTVSSGNATGNTSANNQPIAAITDLLTNTGTGYAKIVYTITPVINGCTGDPQTVTITLAPGVPAAAAGPDQKLCAVTQTALGGNTPATGTGRWIQVAGPPSVVVNPLAPNSAVTGLIPGSAYGYVWEITSANSNCGVSRDTVAVFVRQPTTQAQAGNDTVSCAATFNTFVLQGNLPRSYETGTWTIVSTTMTPVPTLSNPANANSAVSGLTNGNLVLRWAIASDAPGCGITADTVMILKGVATYQAKAGADQLLCNTQSTVLAGNNPVGAAGTWTVLPGSTAVVTNPSQNNSGVTGLVAGDNFFVWTLSNGSCPPSQDTVLITILPPIENTLDTARITACAGQFISLSGSAPSGGNGTYTYQWQASPDNVTFTNIPGATFPSVSVNPTATTYYRRIVISLPCSTASQSVAIVVLPDVSNNVIGSDQTICINTQAARINGSLPSGGNGLYSYQWQRSPDGINWTAIPGAVLPNYLPGSPAQTTYYRRLANILFCNASAAVPSNTVVVIVNPDAKAVFTPTKTRGCAGFEINSAVINLTPYNDRNSEYRWYVNGIYWGSGTAFPKYTMARAGDSVTIKLVAISRFGCRNDSIEHGFATGETPTVVLGPGGQVIAGSTVTLQPVVTNGPVTYLWSPLTGFTGCTDCERPQVVINKSITYRLEVENAYGCKAAATIAFEVKCERGQVYLPDAFSPDDDGINDFFFVQGTGIAKVQYFRIFDRWGNLIFERNGTTANVPAQGWNGKINGRAIQDKYIYAVGVLCTGGDSFHYKGEFTLILAK